MHVHCYNAFVRQPLAVARPSALTRPLAASPPPLVSGMTVEGGPSSPEASGIVDLLKHRSQYPAEN
jgi:hypothetical protein